MKRLVFLILTAIVFLGGLLRFWQLASHPVSLHIDEISIGYNAYSILKTGHDEFGEFLPLAFRSFGDFKAPVLIYMMTPAIAVFGLNEFGVRVTIALIGSLTIFLVYLLTKELSKNEAVSLIASFSMAVSPWHIQFSRATFEAVLALFFMILGAWLFLRAMRLKGNLLWLSAIFFSLSMYSYHAERLTVPFLVLSLAVIFRRKLWQYRKRVMLAVVVGLVIILPLFVLSLKPQGNTRARNEFISKDYEIAEELNWADSKPLTLFNFWLKRYFDYWDLNFLFFDGIKLTQPDFADVGLLHLFEAVPFFLGIWLVFFRKKILRKESRRVLTFWLLIGPLAASLAITPQHPLRSLNTIPVPQILVGLGGFWLFNYLKQQRLAKKMAAAVLTVLIIGISEIYYFDIYYLHFPIHFSEFWSYGMKDVAQYAWQNHDEYEEVVIDPQFRTEASTLVGTPYVYFLFYGQYEPYLFQHSPQRKTENEDSVNFENFTFREIYWPEDRNKKNTLFIGSSWSLPLDEIRPEQVLREIKFKNGRSGFLIVKN